MERVALGGVGIEVEIGGKVPKWENKESLMPAEKAR